MEIIDRLKYKYGIWKEKRFLKKHGFENRRQYDRFHDPDYNIRATHIKDYYHGYPFVYCFTDRSHTIYEEDIWYSGMITIHKWCDNNLSDKFRMDFLRVVKDEYTKEWHINELGGGDYIFIAFKNEQDYIHFLLRWEGVTGYVIDT